MGRRKRVTITGNRFTNPHTPIEKQGAGFPVPSFEVCVYMGQRTQTGFLVEGGHRVEDTARSRQLGWVQIAWLWRDVKRPDHN
jgi:hypothetical protein